MGNFVPQTEVEVEFDGDVIKASFESINRVDMLTMYSMMDEKEVNGESVRFIPDDKVNEYVDKAEDILKKTNLSFNGLIVQGEEITEIDFIFGKSYFMKLIDMLMDGLTKSSTFTGDEELEKKSNKQPIDTLKE